MIYVASKESQYSIFNIVICMCEEILCERLPHYEINWSPYHDENNAKL